MPSQKFIWSAALASGMVGLIIVAILGYGAWQKSKVIIPQPIKKQLSFVIYWPIKPSPLTNNKTTIKYDPTNKLLSYVSTTTDGTKVVISQQATPDSFTDVPQVYTKFISDLQQFSSFDSPNGTVFLVRPKDLSGGQAAVLNSNGTLMFMRPDKDINTSTWKQIFNNLQIIH